MRSRAVSQPQNVVLLRMRFPLFALIAPVVTSLILWFVTSSPYTLLFAAMGPVMALASYGDGRLGDRRRRREEGIAAAAVLEQSQASLGRERSAQRRELRQANPAPNELGNLDALARPRWSDDVATATRVRLGVMAAGLAAHEVDGAIDNRDNLIPLVVGASEGITCVGHPVLSLAVARAVWSQLAWNVAPQVMAAWAVGWERDAISAPASWPIRLVTNIDDVSPSCRYVIDILAPNMARLSDRDDVTAQPLIFIPDYVSGPEARALAKRLAVTSARVEQAHPDAQLPAVAYFSDLLKLPQGLDVENLRASLAVSVGIGVTGAVALDLVRHGPHAIVAGMTGTGKTEFLVSWMLALVNNFAPTEFTFLVIDFKGGSGFARLAELPHCMGIVTDLDVRAASRALHSLRAELRFRERVLNAGGVTDISALPPHVDLARLVILVDEYRALLDRFSELQPLFDDIAARGRALGVHLILGTQRAAGVIAEGILANCALRVAFRVNNVADSMTLMESDAARTLPEIPGRAVVRGIGVPLQHLQGALARGADDRTSLAVARLWQAAHPQWQARRPWLEELPEFVWIADLAHPGDDSRHSAGESFRVGIRDEPEEQRQPTCLYAPRNDGHLLVTGSHGSGKSNLLGVLASQAKRSLFLTAADAEAAWDAVAGIPEGTLVLIDDLETLLAQFSLEHRDAFMEALITLLRTGPSRGIFVVITSHSGAPAFSVMASLMSSTLALAGLPGRGKWHENAVQVARFSDPGPSASARSAHSAGTAGSAVPSAPEWLTGRDYVVVTPRPRRCLAELATSMETPVHGQIPVRLIDVARFENEALQISSPGGAQVFVGDVEDWQAQYSLLARLRSRAIFVFDDCSPAEVRAVRRARDLLPHARRGVAISLSDLGVASRVRLLGE